MNNFLPNEAREPKTKSNYTMPIDEGSYKLRVMSSAIVGFECWENKKPIRYKMGEQPSFCTDAKEPKYFWSFVVYNYDQERIQIMEVTQKTIRNQMDALIKNKVWGDPKGYDITITRKGTKLEDTEYTIVPNPHTQIDLAIKETYDNANINLEALYSGGDPFNASESRTDAPIEDFPDEPAPEEPSIEYPTEESKDVKF